MTGLKPALLQAAIPLRIVHVLEATDGGTGRHLSGIASALRKAGAEVHVVCAVRRNPSYLVEMSDMEAAGVQVVRLDMRRSIHPLRDALAIAKLMRLFHDIRPDVIHLHSSKAGALGRLAAALMGAGPVVYSPHAFSFLARPGSWRSRFFMRIERLLASHTDLLVAVSQSEARIARDAGIAPSKDLLTIVNGVDVQTLPPDRCERVEPGSALLRLGYLGRLEEQKAPMRLVQLAEHLRDQGVDFLMDVAGNGSLKAACVRACRERGLEGRVRFRGFVSDASSFYSEVDLFVMPSSYEGLPYSVLDAMLWEIPVVGFDVPGVRDLVDPGVTGALVRPFSIPDMARALTPLLQDQALRARMGRAARARCLEQFRLEQQVDQLLAAYRTVSPVPVGGRRQRPSRQS